MGIGSPRPRSAARSFSAKESGVDARNLLHSSRVKSTYGSSSDSSDASMLRIRFRSRQPDLDARWLLPGWPRRLLRRHLPSRRRTPGRWTRARILGRGIHHHAPRLLGALPVESEDREPDEREHQSVHELVQAGLARLMVELGLRLAEPVDDFRIAIGLIRVRSLRHIDDGARDPEQRIALALQRRIGHVHDAHDEADSPPREY